MAMPTRAQGHRTHRPWLTDDPPSPRFVRWVRGVIISIWAIVLFAQGPGVFAQLRMILSSMPPGASRRAALESVLQDAGVSFLCVPLVALAIFGFGVFPRRAADVWSTGGPWFVPLWRSSKKPRSDKSADGTRDA
jgi:hypothetical protein